jgi:biopolymer transport protein ExbD
MRYFETRKARIEIIPMIDIMFFLLVFFIMVTLRMIPADGIASRLPTSSTANSLPPPQITIVVDRAGVIHVGALDLNPQQLTRLLENKPDPSHLQVVLAGDRHTPLQLLMRVMDACRRAGVTRIGLAAQQASGS